MAGTVSRTFSVWPGPAVAGTSEKDSRARRSAGRSRHGLRRRNRKGAAHGRACPDCGLQIQDAVAARLGYCSACRDFTRMCGAGRKVISPDVMTMTTWHAPCTNLGVAAWQIDMGRGDRLVLLCEVHDERLRRGDASWLREAIPLDESASG